MTVVINGTTGISTPGLSNSSTSTNTGNVTNSGTVTNASTISVGNATPSASGAGITFPATQSASTDANTLDDYEEGTWTPSLGGSATYTSQAGKYTKVGNLVTVFATLTVNVIGTGSIYGIQNLPFTAVSGISQFGAVGGFAALNVSAYWLYAYLDPSTTSCNFGGQTSLNSSTGAPQPVFKNGASIAVQFTYFTNT